MSAKKIYPNLACRLEFFVEDSSTGLPVSSLSHSDVSSAGYALIDDGVRASTVSVSLTSSAADTTSVAAGKFITINSSRGHYAIDCPSGAADSGSQFVEAVVAFTAGHVVYAVTHEIDYALLLALNTSVNVSSTATAVTTVDGRVQDVQSRIPAALVSGRMDSSVGDMAANTLTASALAADAGAELAALIETYIINEGDATAVLQAIADKIAADWVAGDASPLAIAAAVRSNLATELARIDAAITTRSSQTSVDDVPTNAELATALAAADDATLAAIAAEAVKTAAIKTKTDSLTFTVAGKVDATAVLDSAVQTQLDEIQAAAEAGSQTGFTAVVAARLPIGSTQGWPTELTIGDAYLIATASSLPLFVKDIDDNILAAMGSKTFADVDFVGTLRLSPLTDGTRELDSPPTTIQVTSEDDPGIVFNDDTDGGEFFHLQIPRDKTLLGVTKTRYSVQFILNWGDDATFERTIHLGETKFLRKNAPVA